MLLQCLISLRNQLSSMDLPEFSEIRNHRRHILNGVIAYLTVLVRFHGI